MNQLIHASKEQEPEYTVGEFKGCNSLFIYTQQVIRST